MAVVSEIDDSGGKESQLNTVCLSRLPPPPTVPVCLCYREGLSRLKSLTITWDWPQSLDNMACASRLNRVAA